MNKEMKPGQILKKAIDEGRSVLSAQEGKLIASSLGIPCPPGHLVGDPALAVKRAGELGYPVVAKLCSSRILHKTDVGGVATNLETERQVAEAVQHLLAVLKENDPDGSVLVEKMAPPGIEFIVGLVTDPHLGPVVMAGLGGVFTEIVQDVSFRMAPIDAVEAESLIRSLKTSRLLHAYRGQPEVDLPALVKIIATVSQIPWRLAGISQMDLNPLILHREGLMAVDVKVVLRAKGSVPGDQRGP